MKHRYGTPKETGMSAKQISRARDFAEELVSQDANYPAIVVLVSRKGIIVLHEAFGKLNSESDSPLVELDSIFPLASQTKPITATLAMILVEDGLLSLNHPVVEYIPEFVGENKDKIMVHHLLTHTSGLAWDKMKEHVEKKQGKVEIPPCDKTQHPKYHERLFLKYDIPVSIPPGKEMIYEDVNYQFAGEIVRRISGKSLNDFARERLFGPLGMKDSYYEIPNFVRHRLVGRPEDAPFADAMKFWINLPVGSDGALSTAMDMAIFGQIFLNNGIYGNARILSPSSVAQMTKNQIPGIPWRYGKETGPEGMYGFGWMIQGHGQFIDAPVLFSPETFSHGGAGFVYLWVDPVYELVGAFFSVSLKNKRNYREACMFADIVTAAVVDV